MMHPLQAKNYANEQWKRLASDSATQLTATQEQAMDAVTESFMVALREKTTGNPAKAAILKLKNLADMHQHSISTRGQTLHEVALQAFNGFTHPDCELAEDHEIDTAMKEYDSTHVPEEARNAARVASDGLVALASQITEIYNPLRDDEHQKIAERVGKFIADKFGADVAIGMAQLKLIADDDEREVAEKKLFVATFETLVKGLPQEFVKGHLNHSLEAAAEKAGFVVRAKPDTAIHDASMQGKAQDVDKGCSI